MFLKVVEFGLVPRSRSLVVLLEGQRPRSHDAVLHSRRQLPRPQKIVTRAVWAWYVEYSDRCHQQQWWTSFHTLWAPRATSGRMRGSSGAQLLF